MNATLSRLAFGFVVGHGGSSGVHVIVETPQISGRVTLLFDACTSSSGLNEVNLYDRICVCFVAFYLLCDWGILSLSSLDRACSKSVAALRCMSVQTLAQTNL